MTWTAAALTGLVTMALLAAACRSDHAVPPAADPERAAAAATPNPSGTRPVPLPDLSRMDEAVRAQVQRQYGSLQQLIARPGATADELGSAYGEMGKLFMAAESLEAAETCYVNARALLAADARWPYYLAHLHRLKGESEEAAALFERVLEIRPDEVPALVWLGEMYLVQGRPESADTVLAKALSLDSSSIAARLGLGRSALARRDYRSAVQHLESALSMDPEATSAHYPLAVAYRGLGDAKKAEAHLTLRQRGDFENGPVDPLMQEVAGLVDGPLAYEVRGTRALESGDWAGAAGFFRKGLDLSPDNPSLRHRLATALFQMGDPNGALREFEETARRSPRFAKAHYSLGLLMQAAGRHREAIERFTTAVDREPAYVEARLRLAAALRRTGHLDASLSQYREIMDLAGGVGGDPRVAEAPFGAAITLVRLARYREARSVLEDAVRRFPGQAAIVHALARILAAAPDAAVRDGRAAMTLLQALPDQDRRIDLGETMAMTFAENGQFEDAAAWQRQAIDAVRAGGGGAVPARMTERLRTYERRSPWRSSDPIEFDEAG